MTQATHKCKKRTARNHQQNRIKYEDSESSSYDSADASDVRALCHRDCIYNHWDVFFESVSELSDAESMFLNIESMSEISVLSECASWLSETYSLMRRKTDMNISLAWFCDLTESYCDLLCCTALIALIILRVSHFSESHNTVSQSSQSHDVVVTHLSVSMRLIRSEASSEDESVSVTSYILFIIFYECSHHWSLIQTAAA